jgi:hypothetical protein
MVLSYGCCRVALFVTALAKRGSYLPAQSCAPPLFLWAGSRLPFAAAMRLWFLCVHALLLLRCGLVLAFASLQPKAGSDCADQSTSCAAWAADGECENSALPTNCHSAAHPRWSAATLGAAPPRRSAHADAVLVHRRAWWQIPATWRAPARTAARDAAKAPRASESRAPARRCRLAGNAGYGAGSLDRCKGRRCASVARSDRAVRTVRRRRR